MLSDKLVYQLIFCPTKDRPLLLQQVIQAIKSDSNFDDNGNIKKKIIVVDDSVHKYNQIANQEIIRKISMPDVIYHGAKKQKQIFKFLLEMVNIPDKDLDKYFRPLGLNNWDLGSVRNYILLLVNIWHNNSVVTMLDDDICLISMGNKKSCLTRMAQIVIQNNLNIVGGNLEGMVDASMLEKKCLEFGKRLKINYFKLPKRPVSISGGLLAFSSKWASCIPFPRTYNEDWIWLLYCSKWGGCIIKSNIRAKHCHSQNGSLDYNALHREGIGELFCEGWSQSYNDFRKLKTKSYWDNIIKDELVYLTELKNSIMHYRNGKIRKTKVQAELIIDKTYSIIESIQSAQMINMINDYFINKKLWDEIIRKICDSNTLTKLQKLSFIN